MRRLMLLLLLGLAAPSLAKTPPVRHAAPVRQAGPAIVWDLVRVGMTRRDVLAAYHLESLHSDDSLKSPTNPNVGARLSFWNSGGTVSEVTVTFFRVSPDEMGTLLSGQYGKPASSRTVELPQSMSRGPGEQATRLQWRRGEVTITLDQPMNPIYSAYSEVVYSVHDPNRGELPL